MTGATQQAGRRAWGAAPPPRPAAEQRRAVVEAAAAAAEAMAPQPAPTHPPHPPHRKLALPRLSNAAASPRGAAASSSGDGAPQRRGWGLLPPKNRGAAAAPADSEPPQESIPAQHAAPWAPPPLASASPVVLPGVGALPAGSEDDDAVLIGSAAPSFTTQQPQQGQQQQQQQQQQQAVHPEPGPQRASHAHLPGASAQHSRRPSQLGAEDLPLAALAAAHTRGPAARYSSATAGSAFPASLPSSRGSSAASQHAADVQSGDPAATSVAGWEAGEPPPLQQQQRQRQRQLSSGELAVLRQSLLDLQLPDGGGGGSAGGADADAVPDQLVLQELSSRLGRLDSQKRRVLLAVLAKIDGAAGAAPAEEPPAAHAAHEEARSEACRLVAESAGGTRQASPAEEGGAGGAGQPAGQHDAEAPGSHQHAAAAAVTDALGEQQAAAVPSTVAPGASQQTHHGRERSMADKLAALRLGRSSSLSKPSGDGGGSPSAPLAAAPAVQAYPAQPPPVQPTPPPPQPQPQSQPQHAPSHAQHAATKLQPLVQHRHRERSRLSGDGLRGTRPAVQRASHLSPAASLASAAGGDALAAFAAEHQLGQQGGDAVVTVSPAAGALGDSQELMAQPPQQAAAALPPLSARGGLARTSTLPVLSPAVRQQAGLAAAKASPEAAAVALEQRDSAVAAAPARGSASSGGAGGSGSGAAPLHCQELTFVMLDTWGDSHFVGLSGLQVLGAGGEPLPLAAEQLAADPPDLNVFPGHSGDVRTLDKLVDGTCNTADDAHMWLAPVKRQLSAAVASAAASSPAARGAAAAAAALPEAARGHNVLRVALPPGGAAVSGLRVWNYNKSATDTARGVKRMLVLADGVEVSPPGGVLVRRAPGTAAFPFGQHIPLTTLWSAAAASPAAGKAKQQQQRRTTQQSSAQRAAAAGSGGAAQQQQQQLTIHSESVAWVCNLPDPAAALDYLQRAALLAKAAGPSDGPLAQPGENFATPLPCGFCLRLVLLSSWGCPHYVGLSGLEVRDAVRGALAIRPDQVYAVPSSVALLPGMASDVRTPDKLVDGDASGAPQHSWLAPQETREPTSVVVSLDAPLLLGALRLWNYAKTPSRGVQQLEVYLDEQLVWKGLLQRAPADPAPGQDFSQTLCFSEEALAEAAAAARRRAGSLAHRAGQPPGGAGAAGDPLGGDGVEEWCQEQERVVLVNNGEFIAWPPDGSAAPPTARPGTSVVG